MRTVDPEAYAARRAAILGAAAEVFAARGYDGATTAAICRQAGIGSGTLFHYFRDKRSIMSALLANDLAEVRAFLDGVDRTDPAGAFWAVLGRIARDLAHPLAPGLMVAALQLALRDEELASMLRAGDERVRAVLAELVADAQRDGAFTAPRDPPRAARWVLGIVDAAYLMSADDSFDAAGDAAELRGIVAAYLGAVAPSP